LRASSRNWDRPFANEPAAPLLTGSRFPSRARFTTPRGVNSLMTTRAPQMLVVAKVRHSETSFAKDALDYVLQKPVSSWERFHQIRHWATTWFVIAVGGAASETPILP
jgi:hypothetical protein